MSKDNHQETVKPNRRKRVGFEPKSKIAEISRADFEAARNDPKVTAFFEKAKQEGERLDSEGLIHR
jgi:hypothetical protein